MKNHVFDGIEVFVLVALRAARMRRSDYLGAHSQPFVKGQPSFLDRMNIRETVQVEQRRADAVLEDLYSSLFDFDDAPAQCTASTDCSTLMLGNSRVNCLSDSWRNTGATFSA